MRNPRLSDLERKKLLLEVKQLQKPWYKNPNYLQIVVPLFLGIASLVYAFGSGLIDRQRMDLELTKKQLQYDIQRFNDKKDSLNILNSELAKNAGLLRGENLSLKIRTNSLKDSVTFNSNKLKSINVQLEKKKQSEYKLGCDLHINIIEQILQEINGTLLFKSSDHYIQLREEYWNSQEFKNFQNEINNRSDLTTSQKIEIPLDKEYTLTEHYKLNRKRHRNYLLNLRDSLFTKMVVGKLNKCDERYVIGSQMAKKPYIHLFSIKGSHKRDDDSTVLADSVSLYLYKK